MTFGTPRETFGVGDACDPEVHGGTQNSIFRVDIKNAGRGTWRSRAVKVRMIGAKQVVAINQVDATTAGGAKVVVVVGQDLAH